MAKRVYLNLEAVKALFLYKSNLYFKIMMITDYFPSILYVTLQLI